MSGELRAALTKLDPSYPGYINVSENESGVTITLRGDPKIVSDGSYVCGYERDRGLPGRCVPGDGNCNNYCGADRTQPFAAAPKKTAQTFEGVVAVLTLTPEQWAQLRRQLLV